MADERAKQSSSAQTIRQMPAGRERDFERNWAEEPSRLLDDTCTTPCKHHPRSVQYPDLARPHADNLQKFIGDVGKALQRQREQFNYYDKAHTLFLNWEEDDLQTELEIRDLQDIMSKLRFTQDPSAYTQSHYGIPSEHSQARLEFKLIEQRNRYALNRSNLLILYYGGHGEMDEQQRCLWHPWINPPLGSRDRPVIDWTYMQERLYACEGDVLLILDCCYASSAIGRSPYSTRGFREVLVASGKNQKTNGVNHNSFTRALIRELQSLKGRSCSVSALHAILVEKQGGHNLLNTPIRIGPSGGRHQFKSVRLVYPDPNQLAAPVPLMDSNTDRFQTRVLVSIRLRNPVNPLQTRDWISWLRDQAPPDILNMNISWMDHIRLEAGFQSGSTLLLFSLPISIWNVIPQDESYMFIDLVKSSNLIRSEWRVDASSVVPLRSFTTDKEVSRQKDYTDKDGAVSEIRWRVSPEELDGLLTDADGDSHGLVSLILLVEMLYISGQTLAKTSAVPKDERILKTRDQDRDKLQLPRNMPTYQEARNFHTGENQFMQRYGQTSGPDQQATYFNDIMLRNENLETLSVMDKVPGRLRSPKTDGASDRMNWQISESQTKTLGLVPTDIVASVSSWLKHQSAEFRVTVVRALSEPSAFPDRIIQAIARRLEDKDTFVRQAAVQALGIQSALSDEAVVAVAARLEDDSSYVRWAAVQALNRQPALSNDVIAAVTARLEDENSYVRWVAVQALGRQLGLSYEVVVAVAARLKDDSSYVRWAAVQALNRQPALSNDVMAAITARLEDENLHVQSITVEALVQRLVPRDILTDTRSMNTLREAIATTNRVVEQIPDDHPNRMIYLNRLVLFSHIQYSITGAVGALDEAISMARRVVAVTSDCHPAKARRLHSLSILLSDRFSRICAAKDLDEAVSLARQAVAANSAFNDDNDMYLNYLGIQLGNRISRMGAKDDLEEAISVARQAVVATVEAQDRQAKLLEKLAVFLAPLPEEIGPGPENALDEISHSEPGLETASHQVNKRRRENSNARTENAYQNTSTAQRGHISSEKWSTTTAETMGVPSLAGLGTIALQSSVSLYETINSHRSHQQRVYDLADETDALSGVLSSLVEMTRATAPPSLSALEITVRRCGHACQEFEQEIRKAYLSSGGLQASFLDWAKLRYLGDDIDGFRRLLASYRTTITIALAHASLHRSVPIAESIETYNVLLNTTREDLKERLESIDTKFNAMLRKYMPDAEVAKINEEKLSTGKRLENCAQLSERINEMHISSKRIGNSSERTDSNSISEVITHEGLQGCKRSLTQMGKKLKAHEKNLFHRLVDKMSPSISSPEEVADAARLREEWESTRESMAMLLTADIHLKESTSFIENDPASDAVQIMVDPSPMISHGTNQGVGWRTTQIGGHMDNETLQQLLRDMERITQDDEKESSSEPKGPRGPITAVESGGVDTSRAKS